MSSHTRTSVVTIGTRPSMLARHQTALVARRLEQLWPGVECRAEVIITAGDRDTSRPLPEIGGKGLFTQAIDDALIDGSIDAAVHSYKDLPITAETEAAVASVVERIDARDVLIARGPCTLSSLPPGARVGTSSLRRQAQLLAARPDLQIVPIRGNVDTRVQLALTGDFDAIVIAAAGVLRLGLDAAVCEYLPFEQMLPAPAQGALAVVCRPHDTRTRALFARLDDPAARAATAAERSFLHGLGGGCSAPVAAYAQPLASGALRVEGLAIAPDGSRAVRVSGEAPAHEAHALGARLAQDATARGARAFLP